MIATTANANNVTIIFYPFFNLSNSTARAVFNILITFLFLCGDCGTNKY